MQILRGKRCFLRALETEDLALLYELENDESLWEVSDTYHPFSKHVLKNFIENASQDIYAIRQYRFVIERYDGSRLGCVDLYNFDPHNQRVQIGIALLKKYRNLGYGLESVQLVLNYCFTLLNVRQVCVQIAHDNIQSIRLFEKLQFEPSGILKEWIRSKNNYKDVIIYQKINKK